MPGHQDAKGVMLKNEVEVRNRWKEYFQGLLNLKNDRKLEMNCPGLKVLDMEGSFY